MGREDEAQLILAALAAGRDLLLEGPPGTSKSTVLRAITRADNRPFYFVEGNADLTPAKLLGHHSPDRVMQEGYTEDNFVPGSLPTAMRDGGLLYVEEFNRVPEDTLNTLITAMAEREVAIPRAGKVRASEGFRVIAAMNPFDNVGTERLSGAVADRLCRVGMEYQPAEQEREIVRRKTGSENRFLVWLAVETARTTRTHPDLRSGASVRAALDFVLLAERLAELRGVGLEDGQTPEARKTLVAAARSAAAIKVRARESSGRTADEVITRIVNDILDRNDGPPDRPDGEPSHPEDARETPTGQNGDRGKGDPGRGAAGRASGFAAGGGRIHSEKEASGAAELNRGSRMFRSFARDHPDLAKKLDGGADALEEALAEDAADNLDLLGEMVELYDRADLRAAARRLATKIIIKTARRNVGRRGGRGRLTSARYRGDAGDLDLERTLEEAVWNPRSSDRDVFVLERRRRRRSYALMLDVSGSVKGDALFRSAMALASVAASIEAAGDNDFAVVAFWREAVVLKPLHERRGMDALMDGIFSLGGRGLTDIGLGLRAGLGELERATTQERVGLLLSDGLQTAGEPAGPVAASFPRLHVLANGKGERSAECCRKLAALGGGRCAFVHETRGIPGAVNRCLAA